MKCKVDLTKRSCICGAVVFVIAITMHFVVGISLFNAVMFGLLYLLCTSLVITLNEKFNWLFTTVIFAVSSFLSTYLIQYLLLVEDLRSKISNQKFFLNICCCLVFYLFVQVFTNNVALTCLISHTILLVFAGINYFVYAFRGNEFTFNDIKAISTGMSVASNYHFSLDAQAVNAILLTAVYFTFIRRIHIRFQKKVLPRILCVFLIILFTSLVAYRAKDVVTETWEQKGTYRNGYVLNFMLGIRDSFVSKPVGYSIEAVDMLEEIYENGAAETDSSNEGKPDKKPAIIAIMNESFADLSVIGNLQTNEPVMPFLNSLSDNIIKGYAVASVFGAKTPNSEWEFLTGNSMAYLPSGSVAYQQYLNDGNSASLVSTLQKKDYTCVAMHPYYKTGWSRDKVYPMLGFDEAYFLDDFDQSSLMRKYVSDETLYDKMIARYEEAKAEDENLFLMGITMQNHGGYTDTYDNFQPEIYSANGYYTDVAQYLSLVNQSDQAIEKMIRYFEEEEEPVVICFFGDHQPSLNSSFYQRMNGKGLSGLTLDELQELYEVPFFIWTNYETTSKTLNHSSLNYLSTMLLERAGISLPPYNAFLSDLMKVIPAMNARAYYSVENGEYLHFQDASGKEKEWLANYEILQYNNLFEDEDQSNIFFKKHK